MPPRHGADFPLDWVMLIGCRGLQTVRQATLGIDTDMSLHAEVSLIAFLLGLVHLAVTLATLVLGRARGSLLVIDFLLM